MDNLNAILVLDQSSKDIIKTNTSFLGSLGLKIISSLSDLDEQIRDYSNRVILLEGYLSNSDSFVEVKLYKYLYNLDFIIISTKEDNSLVVSGLAHNYNYDITYLNSEAIISAIMKDESESIEDMKLNIFDGNTNTALEIKNSNTSEIKLKLLSEEFLIIKETSRWYNEQFKELKFQKDSLELKKIQLEMSNEKLIKGHADIIEKTHKLNRTLRQYESELSEDIYNKVNLMSYPNRPVVVYFKEFEPLSDSDNFYKTLVDTLIIQYRKTVKLVKLYDNKNSRYMKCVPEYYRTLYNSFTNPEIIVNDYIAKSGDYLKLFDIILNNSVNLDILIVVDCKGNDDTILSGVTINFNICSNREHLNAFELLRENTIVDSDSDTLDGYLFWNSKPTVNLKTKEELFAYYSSRKIIGKIVDIINYF